jgi:hypothetical protein
VHGTRIAKGIRAESDARRIAREFRELLERGVQIRPSGTARANPAQLLPAYLPKHAIRLFDATYYLTDLREDRSWEGTLCFFVAWVLPTADSRRIYPHLFSKDYSLVWRSPSHFIRSEHENWMGKGDVRWVLDPEGEEILATFEETTNLPLEIQGALDDLTRRSARPCSDPRAVGRLLRRAPDHRLEPYEDFAAPRRKARARLRNLIHRGRDVAWLSRKNDPSSLRFARGYEPDFARVVEVSHTHSRFYGGAIDKFRILSRNRRIQYQFVAAPRHAWIIPPQALTTDITPFGVRSIDVHAAEELCTPGYEYCYVDESTRPPTLHSQIPDGYAGAPSELDPARLDASAWIERLPVIREFRKRVLRRG